MKRIITAIACLLTAAALISCGKASPNDKETDRPSGASAEITDTKAPATETNAPATETDAPETQPSENDDASPAYDFQYEISKEGDAVYLNKYLGTDENVVIPSEIDGLPVTSLSSFKIEDHYEGMFEKSRVKTVKIPETLEVIGSRAFADCKELTEVIVPHNVHRIADSAFENCTKLEKIDLSETNILFVDNYAFNGCTGLTEVKLPAALLEIGDNAFCNCSSLLEIHLPENLTDIGKEAFRNCTSLKTITVPTELRLGCPDGIIFQNVPSLEKIIFDEGRETIEGLAFVAVTSDVEIIIPASVRQFSPYTFYIYGTAKYIFYGDCPESVETEEFLGDATIYYDPSTKGWDNCVWKGKYTLEPIS